MALSYQSPGVYVEEVPSAVRPIAGVGTSTAAFVGVVPDLVFPFQSVVSNEDAGKGVENQSEYRLKHYPVNNAAGTFAIRVNDKLCGGVTLKNDDDKGVSSVVFPAGQLPDKDAPISADYCFFPVRPIANEQAGTGDKTTKTFNLKYFPVETGAGTFTVRVGRQPSADATLQNVTASKVSQVTFAGDPPQTGAVITVDYLTRGPVPVTPELTPVLCTNFGEFCKAFGDFSTDLGQRKLAHAVYGFFNNGGTRCYVVRVNPEENIETALKQLEAIDEIAIVAAPGMTGDTVSSSLVTHCRVKTGDRFAILDSDGENDNLTKVTKPDNSDFAAFYFPWIQVFDPVTKAQNPMGDGLLFVPPSGHVAGVYARVDTERGVHKAPANETVFGAVGLQYLISKAQQDGFNPQGVNCIRNINGNIRIWGARTIGGDANTDFKYVNVRRLFLFLRKSIDQGTQWVVFEPNDPSLWAKITRNVTAFLTNVWRAGALFGNTPQEAFYVKCDAETNPPEVRDLGQVVTEIGVSVVKPAEFVIFRISQWAGPTQA